MSNPYSDVFKPPHRKPIQQQLFNNYAAILYTHIFSTNVTTSEFQENMANVSTKLSVVDQHLRTTWPSFSQTTNNIWNVLQHTLVTPRRFREIDVL